MTMWPLTLVLLSTIAAAEAALVQPTPQSESVVQVGLFGYRVDGSSTSAAWDTEPSLSSTVYASSTLCNVGAGDRTPPPNAAHAWKFSGTVLSKTADEAVVQLNWQRVVDRGQPFAGPQNTIQLTLRHGDRVALDTVIPESSACQSASATFEARFGPRDWTTATLVTPTAGASRGPSGTGSGAGSGSGAGQTVSGKAAAGPNIATPIEAELWLIHRVPGREDVVFHQVVRAPQEAALFAFAPVSISTPSGEALVHVNGSLGVTSKQQLLFVANRHVTFPGQTERKFVANTTGTGKTISPMPTADEVISFDMPSIHVGGSQVVLPDQFSIRLRVSGGRP
jgi:hypothetical protein